MNEMLLTANAFTITAYHPLLDTFDINSLCFENVFILENWFIHEMIFTSSFRSVTFRLDELNCSPLWINIRKTNPPWWTIALITGPCLIKVTRSIPILLMQSHVSRKHKRFITPQRPNLTFAIDVLSQKVLKCCWLKAEADRQRLIKVCLWCTSDLFLL